MPEYQVIHKGDALIIQQRKGGLLSYLHEGDTLTEVSTPYIADYLVEHYTSGHDLPYGFSWKPVQTVYQGGAGTNRHWGSPPPVEPSHGPLRSFDHRIAAFRAL